jgi:hypothetical protein
MIPEPSLLPPEQEDPLRCCLCLRPRQELLELPYGLLCRPCLADRILHSTADDAAALLTAALIQTT